MDGQTVPGQELNSLNNHGATIKLLDSESTPMKPLSVSTRRQNSKFRDFLRHVRLLLPASFLGRTLPWKTTFEQRKVAVYQSRRMAGLNSLLHIIPLAVAGTLLGLHWSKYWVGVSADAVSLQFAAKVHELLMQASLVDILLYIIRRQALNGYLPLGALAGAAQGPQLSYLWSLDFFSAVLAPAKAFKSRHKLFFVFSTSMLLFMTAVVGPSSAVLMISQSGMTHIQDSTTRYLSVSETELFPTQIDETLRWDTQTESISSSSAVEYKYDLHGPIEESYLWPAPTIDMANSNRILQLRHELAGSRPELGGNWTIGTLPTMLSASQLNRFTGQKSYAETMDLLSAEAYSTLQTSQPVVMSACSSAFHHTDNISYFHLDGSTSILRITTELYNTALDMTEPDLNSMLWIQMPQDPTSLLALFKSGDCPDKDPEADTSGNDPFPYICFVICTVSSFWWDTITSLSLKSTGNLVKTDWPGSRKDIAQDKLRPIIISPEVVPGINFSFYFDEDSTNNQEVSWFIVTRLVGALSWIPGLDTYQTHLHIAEDMIKGKNLSSIKDSESYTLFRIATIIIGNGYGGTGTSTQLSLAVIIAYCFITIAYITYIIVTGHTSVAWNSATELITLALQSKVPDDLRYTSVGIDSIDTLRRSVGIRVNTVKIADTGEYMQRLELVFEQDIKDKRKIVRKVERNQAY